MRFVTGRLPVTPVVKGSPVALVSVPDVGMPSTGAVMVGEVSVLLVSVWVSVVPTMAPDGAATLLVRVDELPAIGICPVVNPEIPPLIVVANILFDPAFEIAVPLVLHVLRSIHELLLLLESSTITLPVPCEALFDMIVLVEQLARLANWEAAAPRSTELLLKLLLFAPMH